MALRMRTRMQALGFALGLKAEPPWLWRDRPADPAGCAMPSLDEEAPAEAQLPAGNNPRSAVWLDGPHEVLAVTAVALRKMNERTLLLDHFRAVAHHDVLYLSLNDVHYELRIHEQEPMA